MLGDILKEKKYTLQTKIKIFRKVGAEIKKKKDGSFVVTSGGVPGVSSMMAEAIQILNLTEKQMILFCSTNRIKKGCDLWSIFCRWAGEERGLRGIGALFVAHIIIDRSLSNGEHKNRIISMVRDRDKYPRMKTSLRDIIHIITQENTSQEILNRFLRELIAIKLKTEK